MSEYDELQPNAVDMETAFLGAVLGDPSLVAEYADVLEPGDFFLIRNAWVWEAVLALSARRDDIDNATVSEELKGRGRLVDVGGPAYILKLMVQGGLSIYAGTYAQLILRASFRRKALLMAQDIAKTATNGDIDAEGILARVDALASRLHTAMPTEASYHAGAHAQDDYEAIVATRVSEQSPENFTVHLDSLERYVPAIKPGKLIVISGLSGHGKTIMMEEWAEWLAMLGHRVLYVTTELTAEDHLDRRYTRHSEMSYARIITPTETVQTSIRGLRAKLGAWQHNIDFWEVNEPGHESVIAQMRRAFQHGRRVFFVDYFWEILADDQRSTVDRAVKALHTFAKTTNSLVVVGSQLTETEHGLRTYGTRRLDQKAAVHLQIGRAERLKVPAVYTVNGRVVEVDVGEPDRFRDLEIVKNTYGPAHVAVRIFMDGERLRFVDEQFVSYGVTKTARVEQSAAVDMAAVFRGGE